MFSPSPVAETIFNDTLEVTFIDASVVDINLVEPMTISFGTFSTRPSGWLALSCEINGQNVIGYGEGTTLPYPIFTDDSGNNIATNIDRLSNVVAATLSLSLRDALAIVQDHCFPDDKFYPTARLATEMALLDAAAKAHGMSMKEFLGIPDEITEVPYGKSIGGNTKEAIFRQADKAIENNARKIKIKVGPDIFSAVSSALDKIGREYPEIDLMVDANGGFNPNDRAHLSMIEELDNKGLVMIEEPVSRVGTLRGLVAVRELHKLSPELVTPICLDDCLTDFADCQRAITEGLATIINVKPGRIGSFLESLRLVDFAARKGAEVMVGGMLEATPGRCMTTLLGAYCLSKEFTVPGDLSLAQERLSTDLVPRNKQLHMSPKGGIVLPTANGWGF